MSGINEQISKKLLNRLKQSPYWTDKTRSNGQYINYIKCPECEKLSCWAYKKPFTLQCNRGNNCGVTIKLTDIFPEVIQGIEKEYPSIKADPHRPARVYLRARGLDAPDGLHYEYWPNVRNSGRGAVMFKIDGDTYNGRIINPSQGQGKTHNKGSTAGKIHKHPGIKYDPDEETFIVEGIIDELSIIRMGFQSIAILSANQGPSKIDLSEFKNLVFAFDPDNAGVTALRRWMKHYPNAKAIMKLSGDWNDFLICHPEDTKKKFNENRIKFEQKAKLALIENAQDYAIKFNEFYGHPPGLFTFDNCYYYSYKKDIKTKEDDEKLVTYSVSNFTIEVDHYQLDTTNPDEPVNRFFLKIKPTKGRTVFCPVSANELSSPNSLMQTFLQRARVIWSGDRRPSLAFVKKMVEAKAPVVRQLKIIGHDKESGYYVFKDFAIGSQGIAIALNRKGFIELSTNNQIRPAQYTTIKPVKGISPEKIYSLIYQAWGERGITGVAWMVAGWFVHDIKIKIGFFPFLSFYDETQTGKTRLARFMNACQCLDEEGLPMRKVNTSKGEIRKLAQRASLFKALLEGNNEENSRFDIESILTLYNDNPLQVRALKTNDIQTQEIPFLSSLLFVQNKEPFKSKAQKERVVSIRFKREDITEETSKAFYQLTQIPIAEMAYFFPYVMKHRELFENKWYEEFQKAKRDLSLVIGDARINENHALILSTHRLLCGVLNTDYDLQSYIEKIGNQKQNECMHRDETIADTFLNIVLNFNTTDTGFFDVDPNSRMLFINLYGALQKIKDNQIAFPVQLRELYLPLKEHPAFIESMKNHYFKETKGPVTESIRKKAWVFDFNKINEE